MHAAVAVGSTPLLSRIPFPELEAKEATKVPHRFRPRRSEGFEPGRELARRQLE
ncbi:MAG: hypothetical protein ACE5JI_04455 [Acidobacteriota bacterium]